MQICRCVLIDNKVVKTRFPHCNFINKLTTLGVQRLLDLKV
jgi:hypothetical protein